MPLDIVPTTRLTKSNINAVATALSQDFLEGNIGALELYCRLQFIEKAAAKAKQDVKSDAISECEQDMRVAPGVKADVRQGGEQWVYDHDPEWCSLKQEENAIKAELKERERFLRVLDKEMVDPDTGEVIAPARLMGYKATTLALTFARD